MIGLVLLLALTISLPLGRASVSITIGTLQAHDPILIRSNADFGVPGNYGSGVTGGSGTSADPFIIQGWDIDLSCQPCAIRVPAAAGIRIENAITPITAHFVIQNLSIHDGVTGVGTFQFPGILFNNVQNGVVQNVILNKDATAVDLQSSSHNIFTNNLLTNNGEGFGLISSSSNTFTGNTISTAGVFGFNLIDSSENVFAHNSVEKTFGGFNLNSVHGVTTRNIFTGNTVLNVYQDGFSLETAPANILLGNSVVWTAGLCVNSLAFTCPDGFHLLASNNNILIGNAAKDNPNDGFFLEQGSSNNLLRNNIALRSRPLLPGPGYIVGLGAGFSVFTSSRNTLDSNIADENTAGFVLSMATHNRFTSNLARLNGAGFIISEDSELNVFSHNDAYHNDAGFELASIHAPPGISNTFAYNRVHNNHVGFYMTEIFSGVGTNGYSNETLLGNIIFENNLPAVPYGTLTQNDGIYLQGITASNITSNVIFNNPTGLEWSTVGTLSTGNLVYNNLFVNPVNVNDFVQNNCSVPLGQQYRCNYYNSTITRRMNIIGGSFTGGNFWSDYYGTDLNHGDGIGRTLVPYEPGFDQSGYLPFLGGDYYPLVFDSPQTGTAPDFTGFIIPASLTVPQNTNGTFVLTALSRNGFTGTVSLSAAITPSVPGGPTASFNPTSLSVASIGTVASALNLTNTLLPGTYNVDVTAATPTTSHTGTVKLIVAPVSNPNPTTTTVVCTPRIVTLSHTTSCAATVADLLATTPPTGTVTFAPTGTCTLTGAGDSSTCSVDITPTVAGTLQVSAAYAGDASHASSTGTATVTVTIGATDTRVDCAPSAVSINQASTCTATVTDTSQGTTSTPTGIVTWTTTTSGTFDAMSCNLTGTSTSASCHVAYTPTITGSHQITGSYSGDATHPMSQGGFTIFVGARTTSTIVTCTPSVSVIGQSVSCTATVIDNALTPITPMGTVTFVPSGLCILSGTGASAACPVNITPTQAGPLTVTATYAGDTMHATSSGSGAVTVSLRATSTSVMCNPATVLIGQVTSCTARVTDNAPGTVSTPAGTVTFTVTAGSGTFGSNSCTLTTSGCAVTFTPTSASVTISGDFGGDTTHATSSGTSTVTVSKRNTATTVSCASPVMIGQASPCSATVTDASPAPSSTPTGTVKFASTAGTFSSTHCTLAGGTCSLTFTPSTSGRATVNADYAGDMAYDTSSGSSSITVYARSTTSEISCSPSSVNTGSSTSCTATVTDISASPTTPTGTVSFLSDSNGAFSSSHCSLAGESGIAHCNVSYTGSSSGTHTITARYGGDSTHGSSQSTSQVSVMAIPHVATAVTMFCNPPSVVVGNSVACSVTTTGSSPTGVVTFSSVSMNGGSVAFVASSCTLSSGSCYVSVRGVSPGRLTLTATYPGDSVNLPGSGNSDLTVETATESGANSGASNNPSSPEMPPMTSYVIIAGAIVAVGVAVGIFVRLRTGKQVQKKA